MMQNGSPVTAMGVLVENKDGLTIVNLYDFPVYDSTALQDATFTKVSDSMCELQGTQRRAFHFLSATMIGFKEVDDELLTRLECGPRDRIVEPKKWGKKESKYLTRDCFYKEPRSLVHIEINAPYILRDYRGTVVKS